MRLRRLPRAGGLPVARNVMSPDLYVISARGRLRSAILAFLVQRVHSVHGHFPTPEPEADSVPAFDNRWFPLRVVISPDLCSTAQSPHSTDPPPGLARDACDTPADRKSTR